MPGKTSRKPPVLTSLGLNVSQTAGLPQTPHSLEALQHPATGALLIPFSSLFSLISLLHGSTEHLWLLLISLFSVL